MFSLPSFEGWAEYQLSSHTCQREKDARDWFSGAGGVASEVKVGRLGRLSDISWSGHIEQAERAYLSFSLAGIDPAGGGILIRKSGLALGVAVPDAGPEPGELSSLSTAMSIVLSPDLGRSRRESSERRE